MSSFDFSAAALYGGSPSPQPTATPAATHAPGPAPFARTQPRAKPTLQNPTLILVLLLGIAFALIHFSVHGSFDVGLSA